MAKSRGHYNIGISPNRWEMVAGFAYLPFYLWLTPILILLVANWCGVRMSDTTYNGWIYLVNFLAICGIFRLFLVHSLRSFTENFWGLIQGVVLGFAFYFALSYVLHHVLALFGLANNTANNEAIQAMASADYPIMVVTTVFMAPIIEETIFRGLFFGLIQRKSRILAYFISALLFAMIHVWQFIPTQGILDTILDTLQYMAPAIALGWVYEKTNTIWGPILTHGLINAVAMGLLSLA